MQHILSGPAPPRIIRTGDVTAGQRWVYSFVIRQGIQPKTYSHKSYLMLLIVLLVVGTIGAADKTRSQKYVDTHTLQVKVFIEV